jgi:hypothetical protein
MKSSHIAHAQKSISILTHAQLVLQVMPAHPFQISSSHAPLEQKPCVALYCHKTRKIKFHCVMNSVFDHHKFNKLLALTGGEPSHNQRLDC